MTCYGPIKKSKNWASIRKATDSGKNKKIVINRPNKNEMTKLTKVMGVKTVEVCKL